MNRELVKIVPVPCASPHMENFTLIFDPSKQKVVEDKILPAFKNSQVNLFPYKPGKVSSLEDECCIITFVKDEDLAEIVTASMDKQWTIGFLPHSEMTQAIAGFGISEVLTEAIEDIKQNESPIISDLLLCNDRPVFNTVVIGNTLSVISGSVSNNSIVSRFEKLSGAFKHFGAHTPRAFNIEIPSKQTIKTAALGIVVVLHGKSSLLSRKLLKDNFVTDGMLNCLVLAPRSIMELIRFSISSAFNRSDNQSLPNFIGHLRTKSIIISSSSPMDFSQDNNLMSSKHIELSVCEKKIKILPGRYLKRKEEKASQSEIFKTKHLPTGEAYLKQVASKPLSLIYHASTEEFKDLFKVLRENAKTTNAYLILMALSTMLATFGLFANSSPVIIGAMILAPLMSPIISLSMGVLRQDRMLIVESMKAIGFGLLIGYLAAIFLTWVTPLQNINEEITARIRPTLLDLGIAIVSGVAGAFAHAREEIAKTLAGVAIAVALVPPLAVSGIGLGWFDIEVFGGALLLLLTNLAGIVLSGSLTFLLLGFSPFQLAKKGLLISLVIVGLVSLPLGYGFSTMVRENSIVRSIEGYTVDDIKIKEVSVIRGGTPMLLSVKLVALEPIDEQDMVNIRDAVASKINREVELEITVSIKK